MFTHHTLDNGLEIIAECNPAAYSLATGFFVNTGSRDETNEISGVSHFLEHMMFKGTSKRSAADVNREIDELGAHANAYTSEETTCYYAVVLPELQDRIIDLLADILRPSLNQDDFDMEKQVILEEIKMYEDHPPFGADELCREYFFGSHPLKRSVLGSRESVADLTLPQMRKYFESRYAPNNIALVACGNVDFKALVRKAEQMCGEWTSSPADRKLFRPTVQTGFHQIHKESATQQYVMQMFDGVSSVETMPERYAAYLLAHVIGDDVGSRFYWELLDPGIAESYSFSMAEYTDAGVYVMTMSCAPEQMVSDMERVEKIYCDLQKDGVSEEELARNKIKILSRTVLSSERPGNRLFHVGGDWLHNREYYSLQEELALIRDVSLLDIRAVLEKYPLKHPYTITVGPM